MSTQDLVEAMLRKHGNSKLYFDHINMWELAGKSCENTSIL